MLLSATLSHFAFGLPSLVHLDPLWWITATTTITSGMMYMDGSGRATITNTVKEKVVIPVTERVKVVVSEQASIVEQKVLDVISKSKRD